MTVLRGLQRAQLWNTSGYVCHSCRYKLILGRRQLTRSQTHLSTSDSGGGADDWFSNFNDLSEIEDTNKQVTKQQKHVAPDFTRANAPKKKSGRGNGRDSGERAELETMQTAMTSTDVLDSLIASGKQDANSTPEASGSPPFLRPVQGLINLESRKLAREVRIKIEAKRASAVAEREGQSTSETMELRKEEDGLVTPSLYPPLDELAAGVEQHGILAEAMKISRAKHAQGTKDELPKRHYRHRLAAKDIQSTQKSINFILSQYLKGEHTLKLTDEGDVAADIHRNEMAEAAVVEDDGKSAALKKYGTYADHMARLGLPSDTPISLAAAEMAKRRRSRPPPRGRRMRSFAGMCTEYERVLKIVVARAAWDRSRLPSAVDADQRDSDVAESSTHEPGPPETLTASKIEYAVAPEQDASVDHSKAMPHWRAFVPPEGSAELSRIREEALRMAERRVGRLSARGAWTQRTLVGWRNQYENTLLKRIAKRKARRAVNQPSGANATQLESVISGSPLPTDKFEELSESGDEVGDKVATYSPITLEDVSEGFATSEGMTNNEKLASAGQVTATSSPSGQLSQFEDTLQQLLPAVKDILAQAMEASREGSQAGKSKPEPENHAALSELMEAIKHDQLKGEAAAATNDNGKTQGEATRYALSKSATELSAAFPPQMPTFAGALPRTSEPNSIIPSSRGARPPPQQPSFVGGQLITPTAANSVLGSEQPLSLGQMVEEGKSRPKWGGVTAASGGNSMIPPSSVRYTTAEPTNDHKADEVVLDAPFRPFGVERATSSEPSSGDTRFLDSMQKATRFDTAASSKVTNEKITSGETGTALSHSRASVGSWLWKAVSSPFRSSDTAETPSEPDTTSKTAPLKLDALQDLNLLQQRLSSEMSTKAQSKGSTITQDASAHVSEATDDNARTAATPEVELDDNSTKSPAFLEFEQVDEPHDTVKSDTEAPAAKMNIVRYPYDRYSSSAALHLDMLGYPFSEATNQLMAKTSTSAAVALDNKSIRNVEAFGDIRLHLGKLDAKVGLLSTDAKHSSSWRALPAFEEDPSAAARKESEAEGYDSLEAQKSPAIASRGHSSESRTLNTRNKNEHPSHFSKIRRSKGRPDYDAKGAHDLIWATHTFSYPDGKGLMEGAPTQVTSEHDELVSGHDASERLASLYSRPISHDHDEHKHGKEDNSNAQVRSVDSASHNDNRSDAETSQAAATSANVIESASGNDSASSAGSGGDDNNDGDDKPLWEVMSRADSLTSEVPAEESPTQFPNSNEATEQDELPLDLSTPEPLDVFTIKPSQLEVTPLNIPQPVVPGLEYGLDRVLFNSGVYQLQDPLSRVYNFDPYLQKIMPVVEFDFNALKEYKTSSQDTLLAGLANEHGKRYIGSTSSMTGMLGHFHYLLSDWRPLNLNMISRGFTDQLATFTMLNRAPNAIFLRRKNGTYAIDADKQYDSGNVLMLLGKSMEKLLTTPTSEYERYRKSDPRTVSEEERTAPEAFEYTTMGDFLMRSQLDAHDPRLPGTGMFDLKTRAVLSVRMDAEDFKPMTGYEIHTLQGRFGSYEREFYDMMRSTMLKYMLQARMGRMDGIFIAYHNVERIFGFQYMPIQELDRAIHGQVDRCLGDQEFKTSLELVNKIFDKATAKFPEQSLRFHFETTTESLGGSPTTVMWIFAEPMTDTQIDLIQSESKAKIAEFERTMMGIEKSEKSTVADVDDPTVREDVQATNDTTPAATAPSIPRSTGSLDSSEYITSNTGGDPDFLDEVASSSTLDAKPLFAASLICKSRINGIPVERPENLKNTDVWEVEYLLREWDAPEAMWARYAQMKARRKELFEKLSNEEEIAENGNGELTSKQKRERAYIEFLRSMSRSGREFRSKIDQLEAGKEPVIVGQPFKTSGKVSEAEVGNVEKYMAWLYGKKSS